MIRATLRIITVLSLLLFMGCAYLWVRSYSVSDFCKHEVVRRDGSILRRQTVYIICGRGGVCFNRVQETRTGQVTLLAPATRPAATQPAATTQPVAEPTEEAIQPSENDGWDQDRLMKVGYAGNYLQLANQPTRYGFAKTKLEYTKAGSSIQSSFTVVSLVWPVLVFGILPLVKGIRLVAAFRRYRRLKKLNYHEVHSVGAA
jgi:hypothetical protein